MSKNIDNTTKEMRKAEALKQVSINEVSINNQLDYHNDPMWKEELMKFCVSSMNNQFKDLDIELKDIQQLYATHLVNSKLDNNLWKESNKHDNKTPFLEEGAKSNAVPSEMLIKEYNIRLEKEGRSNEKLKTTTAPDKPYSKELQAQLDNIAGNIAHSQKTSFTNSKKKAHTQNANPGKII